jgi:hypothetical protein
MVKTNCRIVKVQNIGERNGLTSLEKKHVRISIVFLIIIGYQMSRTSNKTLESNSIKYMLKHVEEYEKVKNKEHKDFKFARDYFKAKGICFQNFYKFYGMSPILT